MIYPVRSEKEYRENNKERIALRKKITDQKILINTKKLKKQKMKERKKKLNVMYVVVN